MRYLILLLMAGSAFAQAPECVAPAELQHTRAQRDAAQNEVAAIVAKATAEIARLNKELEAAKKPEAKK